MTGGELFLVLIGGVIGFFVGVYYGRQWQDRDREETAKLEGLVRHMRETGVPEEYIAQIEHRPYKDVYQWFLQWTAAHPKKPPD